MLGREVAGEQKVMTFSSECPIHFLVDADAFVVGPGLETWIRLSILKLLLDSQV